MEQTKPKKYTYFIGTDVSRNKLDHAVMKGRTLLFHQETGNDSKTISAFIQEIKQLPGFTITKAIFCMEQTGIYTNHLLTELKKVKANVVIDGPLQIRNSLGNIRAKNDRIDAIRIAEYAYKNRESLRLWIPRRPIIQQLADLSTLRSRLVMMQGMLSIPLKEQNAFSKKSQVKQTVRLCTRSNEALLADIKDADDCIAAMLKADDRLKRLMELITSVVGVGPVTAVQIIICTNEFRDIRNPKKFACYAGVAPFIKESGTSRGKSRVSPIANKKMKALLHICAMQARRFIPELQAFYLRKTVTEGKHKMSVLNALRYKMILRIFACVNQDRLYQREYQRPETILCGLAGQILTAEVNASLNLAEPAYEKEI